MEQIVWDGYSVGSDICLRCGQMLNPNNTNKDRLIECEECKSKRINLGLNW